MQYSRQPRRTSHAGSLGRLDVELPSEVFTHPMRMPRSGSVPTLGGKDSDELFSYKQYSSQPRRSSLAGSFAGSGRGSVGSCGSVKSYAE